MARIWLPTLSLNAQAVWMTVPEPGTRQSAKTSSKKWPARHLSAPAEFAEEIRIVLKSVRPTSAAHRNSP